mgnify:CR=1 FL=1
MVLASGCSGEAQEIQRAQHLAFGTVVDIQFADVGPDKAAVGFQIVREDLDFLHATWHPWEPGSLTRVNQLLPFNAEFSIGPSILGLLERSQALHAQSDGLFNPAIGKLVDLWGFHAQPEGPRTPPDEAAIRALLDAAPSPDDIVIDGVRARGTNPAVQLDFGGVAKGFALGQLSAHLVELGYADLLINAGGDLIAIGRPAGRPWRVGIRHPRRPDAVLASLSVAGGESVFTSGDYERSFTHDGVRYHHMLDPRTGRPARGLQSVTVVTQDPALADAAATALFVAGPDAWPRIARRMGVEQVMVVEGDGSIAITPALAERVTLAEDAPQPRVTPLSDGGAAE